MPMLMADKAPSPPASIPARQAPATSPVSSPLSSPHVIARSQTRILAYLNISFADIYGFSGTISVGEAQDMRRLAVR